MRHSSAFFLGLSALTGALVLGSGCQSSSTTSSLSGGGGFGGFGSSNATNGSATTGNPTSTTGSGASTSASGTGGGMTVDATIQDITTLKVGHGIGVTLKGVVAMSHKFLISQSSSSGSCLWGVFLSAPGLTETAANTGLLATSYGTNATIADGGTKAFCPVPPLTPAGDGFPDDVAPGDVLDIVGKTDYFNIHQKVPADCTGAGESLVAQYQISNINPGGVTRTMTKGPVPAPHAVTMAEIAQLASATDTAYHDQWGGVKVRVANVTSVAQMVMVDGGTVPSITDQFGNIVMMGSGLQVGDKIFYQGLLKKNDICRSGPVYANDMTTFTEIDGFSYLNFCTWGLVPESRCSDFKPASDDCGTNTCL